jgi:hypothetical protein
VSPTGSGMSDADFERVINCILDGAARAGAGQYGLDQGERS